MAAVPRKFTRQLQTEMQTAYTPPHPPVTTAHQTSYSGKIACKTDRPGERMPQAFCVNYLIHPAPLRSTLLLCTIFHPAGVGAQNTRCATQCEPGHV
jgi:hypothetical protein